MTVTRFNDTAIALNDGRVLVVEGTGGRAPRCTIPRRGPSRPATLETADGLAIER